MTVGSSLIAVVLAAGSVSIDVEPGTMCVASSSLSQRLEKAGLRVLPDANLRVHVQRDGSRLEVRGRKNGHELQRAFTVRLENCASAEQLVTTLVLAWAEELPAPPPAPRVIAAAPPTLPAPAPETPAAPEPIVIDVIEEEEARKVLRPPEPEEHEVAPPSERRSYLPEYFSSHVTLFGGITSGSTLEATFTGQIDVAVMFGRFGVEVDGGFETSRSTQYPAPIDLMQSWLSLSAAAEVPIDERLSFHFALGARLWMIAVRANWPPYTHDVSFVTPGGVASAGVSFHVWGPLRGHIRGYFATRLRVEQLEITNYGTAFSLQPWQGGVLVGVDWRFL